MRQESLFNPEHAASSPLAYRVRPTTLDGFKGQDHLLGPGKLLRQLIAEDQLPSLIFWGPPGVGKTTLAEIIAQQTDAHFITFSAVTSGIKEIRKIMDEAEANRDFGDKTIVFIDEIHRFNKAQQDAFLPYVERGSITLIGATTENPSFEINAALLSRCKVLVLKELSTTALVEILTAALANPHGFPDLKVTLQPDTLQLIAEFANGDGRMALNTLEMAVLNGERDGNHVTVTATGLSQLINTKSLRYDKNGEEHYNVISALHKSMRNSDVDAAIYWLTRMLAGGEDPLYIARRLIRFASEDVGLADRQALPLTVAAYQACQLIGMPECNVNLTEAVTYLALAPKSNALYAALSKAQADVKATGNLPVPLQIRNAPTKLMKDLGYGDHYQYAHDTADKLTDMQTMPPELAGHTYYQPTDQGQEQAWQRRLAAIKRWHAEHPRPNGGL
ncbi:replication-associated recombination protein A [Lactiplantibacillus garii]|uniref:Replication-associated recombination protein A n=1 Tax=Lactiplantibacillus garii TaxID=2306423 RepID=A0A3R8L038_9LACO|nr:replication-associated recombination protein A [Lactiplantibacillus garii]RRK09860.1 replication-associated recombination protein A [Lactiplantibacillus garii]